MPGGSSSPARIDLLELRRHCPRPPHRVRPQLTRPGELLLYSPGRVSCCRRGRPDPGRGEVAKPVSTNAKRPAAEARPPTDQPATRSPLSRRLHPTAKKNPRRLAAHPGRAWLSGSDAAGDRDRGGREQGGGLVLLRRQGAARARAARGHRRHGLATFRRPPGRRRDARRAGRPHRGQRRPGEAAGRTLRRLLRAPARSLPRRQATRAPHGLLSRLVRLGRRGARAPGADSETRARTAATLGQFAAILLDGIFMQMVVGAPDFDLETALHDARRTLRYLLDPEAADGGRRL